MVSVWVSPICRPHLCASCGANVEALGDHVLSCRFSKGRQSRHATLNDIVKQTLVFEKILCQLETSGLFRLDGKRLDGASVVPWKRGKVLIWDVTRQDTLGPSHLRLAVREAGAVADDVEFRKTQKYSNLVSSHFFVPLAVESLGVWNLKIRKNKQKYINIDKKVYITYKCKNIS